MNTKLSASKPGTIAVALLTGLWSFLVTLAAYSIFTNTHPMQGLIRQCLELAGSCAVFALALLWLLGARHQEACQAALFLTALALRPVRAARNLFVRRRSIPSPAGSARRLRPRPAKPPPCHPRSRLRTLFAEQKAPMLIAAMTRNSMPLSANQPAAAPIPAHYTDLSPGARHFGIRPRAVFIESDILDSYTENEVCLGRNVAGTILAALACHAAGALDDVPDGSILVRLVRRDDGCLVRRMLHVRRLRRHGIECLLLNKAGDREIDWDFN